MKMTRRTLLQAATTVGLQMQAAIIVAQDHTQAPTLGGDAPKLPDKASFPDVKGVYVNAARTHPRSVGSMALVKKALGAIDDPSGYRPDPNLVRAHFAKLINADLNEVAFVPTAQAGEALVAAGLGLPAKGAHVVSDILHFIGAQMMYLDMQKRGLAVTWVKTKDDRIPLEDMDNAIVKGKTRLVAVSSTSMVTGYMHDMKRLSEIAHAKGAWLHVDAMQTAGNAPIDVKDWGIDSLAVSTYKWLMSPPRVGFLYVSKASQAKLLPPVYHYNRFFVPGQKGPPLPVTHIYPYDAPGDAIVDGYETKDALEGVLNTGYAPEIEALASLEYSLPYIMNIGVANIQSHAQALTDRLKIELPKRGYPLLTPLSNASPIVTIAVKDAKRLQPVIAAAGVELTTLWNHIRVSISVFNDMNDVDRVISAIPKLA